MTADAWLFVFDGDTDNTGENVHAYYGDILFRRIAPPRLTFASD